MAKARAQTSGLQTASKQRDKEVEDLQAKLAAAGTAHVTCDCVDMVSSHLTEATAIRCPFRAYLDFPPFPGSLFTLSECVVHALLWGQCLERELTRFVVTLTFVVVPVDVVLVLQS